MAGDRGQDDRALYIVTTDGDVEALRQALAGIEGAELIRPLPPGRAVVRLRSPADRPHLAALPGVLRVLADRLQHPDRPA